VDEVRREGTPVTVPRVGEDEVGFALLGSLGFEREAQHVGYAATASSGPVG
jgi:hypothetical protein